MQRRMIVPAILAACLSGCAGGPSNADLEKAALAFAKANMSPNLKFVSFKVGECRKSDDKPGYACSVDAPYEASLMGIPVHEKLPPVLNVDRIDGEWKVIGVGQ